MNKGKVFSKRVGLLLLLINVLVPMFAGSIELPANTGAPKDTADASVLEYPEGLNYNDNFHPPYYPEGVERFKDYLLTNIQLSEEDMYNGVEGLEYFSFIVEKDGSVDSVQILKSISPYMDKEIARVLKEIPGWAPGVVDGHPVRARLKMGLNVGYMFGYTTKKATAPIDIEGKKLKKLEIKEKALVYKKDSYSLDDYMIIVDDVVQKTSLSGLKKESILRINILRDSATKKKYNATEKKGVVFVTTM